VSSQARKISRQKRRSKSKKHRVAEDSLIWTGQFLLGIIRQHGKDEALKVIYNERNQGQLVGSRAEWARWVRGSKTTFTVYPGGKW
jgi:hypothetical protein